MLLLSVFTGYGLLDRGFEANGFCTVSAGDILWGRNICDFSGIKGKFEGVFGGSPCQDFSKARRCAPTGNGLAMIEQFKRVVLECAPGFYLLENVPSVPDVIVPGYKWQRFSLCPTMLGYEQRRLRHFQYGYCTGSFLQLGNMLSIESKKPTVTASDMSISFRAACELQGLETVSELSAFTVKNRYKLIGNGVHLGVAKYVGGLIKTALETDEISLLNNGRFCGCGCGRGVSGRQQYYDVACRQRVCQRKKMNC